MPPELTDFLQSLIGTIWEWASAIWEIVVEFWNWAAPFLNSNFITSALGSLAGAYGGAYAVQRISDKAKFRETVEREIANSNSAILMATDALNVFLTLKQQQVIGLSERYKATQRARQSHRDDIASGRISRDTVFQPLLDLNKLEALPVTPEPLIRCIEEKLKVPGQIVLMAGAYRRSAIQLSTAIEARNKLIDQWMMGIVQPGFSKEQLYFGTRNPDGHMNETYPSYMATIEKSVDDCIWFSLNISNSLQAYGKEMQAKLGKHRPKVIGINLVQGYEALVPASDEYNSWIAAAEAPSVQKT